VCQTWLNLAQKSAVPPTGGPTSVGMWKARTVRDVLSAMLDGREIDLVQKRLLTNPFQRREILATRRVLYTA